MQMQPAASGDSLKSWSAMVVKRWRTVYLAAVKCGHTPAQQPLCWQRAPLPPSRVEARVSTMACWPSPPQHATWVLQGSEPARKQAPGTVPGRPVGPVHHLGFVVAPEAPCWRLDAITGDRLTLG